MLLLFYLLDMLYTICTLDGSRMYNFQLLLVHHILPFSFYLFFVCVLLFCSLSFILIRHIYFSLYVTMHWINQKLNLIFVCGVRRRNDDDKEEKPSICTVSLLDGLVFCI